MRVGRLLLPLLCHPPNDIVDIPSSLSTRQRRARPAAAAPPQQELFSPFHSEYDPDGGENFDVQRASTDALEAYQARCTQRETAYKTARLEGADSAAARITADSLFKQLRARPVRR